MVKVLVPELEDIRGNAIKNNAPNARFRTGVTRGLPTKTSNLSSLATWYIADESTGEYYSFDGWLRLHHENSITLTQHPVAYQANTTDHSFVNPKRFAFDILVTDVRTSVPKGASNFSGTQTRSVNAYKLISAMQDRRNRLTLNCKYGLFKDVLIESFVADDDFRTSTSLRGTLQLTQLLIATVWRSNAITNQPQATDKSKGGQVNAFKTPDNIKAKTSAR